MASQQQLPTPLSATLASPTSLHLPRNSHILMDVDTSSNTNTDDLEEEAATVASSPDLDLTHQHSPPASATGPTLPSFHALLGNSTALSKTPGSKQRKTSARLPTPKGLTRSQRIALNPPPKTIQCEFPGCSKRFVYQSQYKSHFLVHNRDRPYACDFEGCNSSYTTRNRLKIHQRA
ncbi:hypothetical protein BC830DRAFT_1234416 [Chytriomyces sp. MP71]|nr:hypothetical protein BC830DRAFT_1234416 [Chytriomyces sp. MP71]